MKVTEFNLFTAQLDALAIEASSVNLMVEFDLPHSVATDRRDGLNGIRQWPCIVDWKRAERIIDVFSNRWWNLEVFWNLEADAVDKTARRRRHCVNTVRSSCWVSSSFNFLFFFVLLFSFSFFFFYFLFILLLNLTIVLYKHLHYIKYIYSFFY